MDIMTKAQKAIDKAAKKCSRCGDTILYSGYAEQGYTDPESGVIACGNWNNIKKWNEDRHCFDLVDDTPSKLAQRLEKMGVVLEWSDEWTSCTDCGKLVRTSPDSYGWQPSYAPFQDGYLCLECIDPKAHLERCEESGNGNSIASINPEDHGYVKVGEDFENGFYGGQSADPEVIMKAMRAAGIKRFILNLDDVGQFDMEFSVWVHKKAGKKMIEKAREILRNPVNTEAKIDPAKALSKALKNAPTVQAPPGGGIVYTKIDVKEGTSETRIVSPDEFREGIK